MARTGLPDQFPVSCFSVPGFGGGVDEIPDNEIPDGSCPADTFFLLPVDVAIKLIESAALAFSDLLDGIGDDRRQSDLSPPVSYPDVEAPENFLPALGSNNF